MITASNRVPPITVHTVAKMVRLTSSNSGLSNGTAHESPGWTVIESGEYTHVQSTTIHLQTTRCTSGPLLPTLLSPLIIPNYCTYPFSFTHRFYGEIASAGDVTTPQRLFRATHCPVRGVQSLSGAQSKARRSLYRLSAAHVLSPLNHSLRS